MQISINQHATVKNAEFFPAISTENLSRILREVVWLLQTRIRCATIVVQGGDTMDADMTFPVTIQESIQFAPRAQMLVDADQILSDFNADYTEMAK